MLEESLHLEGATHIKTEWGSYALAKQEEVTREGATQGG